MAAPGAESRSGAGHTLKAMSANRQTWFGQPRGLTILFLTETWEIFSFYGMRALLVYYMTKQLLIGQEKASLIYGTYQALAYFTPIFGGLIADKWLGKRRAVIDFGWIKLRGALAWWLWGFAHIYFLIGVRNRLSVAINWLWIYARDQRGARLITWWGGEVEGTAPFARGETGERGDRSRA